MISVAREAGPVDFPAFLSERVYMHEFRMDVGLPEHLKRWQRTVDQMLVGVDTDEPIYLMIDQKEVMASAAHRRPGLHVDGYWNPSHSSWDDGKPPAWNAVSAHGGHMASVGSMANPTWLFHESDRPEAIILASDICASRGLIGEFDGSIKVGGDVSHLDLGHMEPILLQAGRAYQGNVCFVHESLPVFQGCRRTLVRLHVPGHSVN